MIKPRNHALELEDARVASLTEACAGLLAILDRDGGFRTAKQQATMRGARALLVELGERVDREKA